MYTHCLACDAPKANTKLAPVTEYARIFYGAADRGRFKPGDVRIGGPVVHRTIQAARRQWPDLDILELSVPGDVEIPIDTGALGYPTPTERTDIIVREVYPP